MPTYEYQCGQCGTHHEEFQSITAKPLRKCPACGKNTLKRCISTGAGVIFKGSGFWQTDYRNEGYKKAAEADKPVTETKSESGSTDKAAAKSDTKPNAEKPAAKSKSGKKTSGKKSDA